MQTLLLRQTLFLLFFLATLFLSSAIAQNTIYVSNGDKSIVLDTLWFYEDPSGRLTFEEAINKDFVATDECNFGISSSTYWVKVNLSVETSIPVFLELNYPALDSVTFFFQEDGKWLREYAGDTRKIKDINYRHYQPLLSLDKNSGNQTVFLKVASEGKVTIPLQIQTLEEIIWTNTIYNVLTGGYYGIVVVMILYNLSLFLFLKDRTYIAYVFLLFGAGLYSINLYGHGYLFIHGNVNSLSHTLILQGMGLYYVFVYMFTRFFLSLKKVNDKLDKFMMAMSALGVFYVIATFFVPYATLAKISVLFTIFTQFLMLGVCIYTWRKGVKATRIFLLAWSFFFIGAVLASLSIQGVIADNFVTRHSSDIGFLLQIVLFSIALSDRYRIFKKEKETAQAELLEMQQEQTEKLETLVQERTQEIRLKQEEILTQNEELHQQQEEIMAQRDFIESKNSELQKVNDRMEEQNRLITDSIRYAKDIQFALLPKESKLQQAFDEHFVLFKPRDIVSGDFYWFGELEGKKIFAVGDCTGHGVPGAFMSMIGNDLLTHGVLESHITDPAKLLERMHKGVRHALKQEQKDNSDGMEVGILVFDKEKKEVAYAGAKIPLIYIQNGQTRTIKADKKAIGGVQKEDKREFTTHYIAIDEATNFYMFSDGYQDQFGHRKTDRKRFQSNYLIKLIENNHNTPYKEQKEMLEKRLEEWQGELKQIDDILVVGLKV